MSLRSIKIKDGPLPKPLEINKYQYEFDVNDFKANNVKLSEFKQLSVTFVSEFQVQENDFVHLFEDTRNAVQ